MWEIWGRWIRSVNYEGGDDIDMIIGSINWITV